MADKNEYMCNRMLCLHRMCSIHFSLYFSFHQVHVLCLRLHIYSCLNAADLIEISKGCTTIIIYILLPILKFDKFE